MIAFLLSNKWHPEDAVNMLGYIPEFLSVADPRPAQQQLHENYAHGGGWNDFQGFKLHGGGDEGGDEEYSLEYPGDPAYHEVGRAKLRAETVVVFQHAWVAVIQPDGSHRIARMD